MTRRVDAHRALERMLLDLLGKERAQLRSSWSRSWASITFSGARHVWEFETDMGAESASWLTVHEFSLPDHIVADLTTQMVDGGLRIEALTVETGQCQD